VRKTWLALIFILIYTAFVTLLFRIPFLDEFSRVFLIKDTFNSITPEMSFLILLLFPIIIGGLAAWVFAKYEQNKRE